MLVNKFPKCLKFIWRQKIDWTKKGCSSIFQFDFKSYGWWVRRALAWDLLNMSLNSWYSDGMLLMSTGVVSESLESNLETNNLNTCTLASQEACAKAATCYTLCNPIPELRLYFPFIPFPFPKTLVSFLSLFLFPNSKPYPFDLFQNSICPTLTAYSHPPVPTCILHSPWPKIP